MRRKETPYLETEALLAVLKEDDEELDTILGKMLPGELAKLVSSCYLLADRAREARRRRPIQKGDTCEPST
jgi:hypothetical protein